MTYRLIGLIFVLGSLVGGQGQTCNSTCENYCAPMRGDLGQAGYNNCLGRCEESCAKCTSPTGTLYPKYYVLGLVYAPPGCTGTTAQPQCAGQSLVDYFAQSSMGTKTSLQSVMATGLTANASLSFGDPNAQKIGGQIGVSGSYTTTDTDTSSQTISKGYGLEIKAFGNGDGVDHDQDTFILLLNPAIALQLANQFSGLDACEPQILNWYVGVNSPKGNQFRYELTVAQLKNPASINPDVLNQLKQLGFTNADYQTILSLDPFANGSTTVDPNRFTPTTYSFPYEPATTAQGCNGGGVCNCLSMAETIKNDFETESGVETSTQYTVGASASVTGINLAGIFKLGFGGGATWTWTSSSTTTDITDDSQSATATVSCPSPNYSAPETFMSVYWDNLFGSFLFVPTVLNSSQTTVLSRGTVNDASGRPVAHEPVVLSIGAKAYHTYTDRVGKYVVVSHTKSVRASTGELSVKGARKTVKLSPTEEVNVSLK